MNHDEPDFEKKLKKFSVAKQCPQCGQLTLAFENKKVYCKNCGYEEQMPSIR